MTYWCIYTSVDTRILVVKDLISMSDLLDTVNCACFNLRKTARLVAQVYDQQLRPLGLNNTKFTTLATTIMNAPISITDLADLLSTDRTTLTRNIKLLEKDDLLAIEPGDDSRSRNVVATAQGKKLIKQALPEWKIAQEKVLEQFGKAHWKSFKKELETLDDIAKDYS